MSVKRMDYDTALDYFWGMTKGERRAVDRDSLSGKEEAALDDVILAESDINMRKYVAERTIGRAKAKDNIEVFDDENLAEKLKDLLLGNIIWRGNKFMNTKLEDFDG